MRIKFHLQAAALALEQFLKGALADVEAAFLREGVGIGQAFRGATGVPAAVGNIHFRAAIAGTLHGHRLGLGGKRADRGHIQHKRV